VFVFHGQRNVDLGTVCLFLLKMFSYRSVHILSGLVKENNKNAIQTIHTYANNANVIYCTFYYLRFPLLSFTLNAVSRERNNKSYFGFNP